MEQKKECIICGNIYTNLEFPTSFERMVTCGDIKCAGKRRYQKWRERYDKRARMAA
ncbi:MAG TPA: hypothetical protein VFF28_02640 [Candidatus Nanoarchaeia archaeon]|nr:hypothetical protein [Candidatus Nanoarchaeia archaeon]